MKKLKQIPKFNSEQEESLFWQTVDSTQYVDWSKAEHWQFPNLKLTSVPITIRMPEALLDRIKVRAHAADLPYQTFIKQLIQKGMVTPA